MHDKADAGLQMVFTAKAACAVLGVAPECSPCEARRAYRRQLLEAHPDKGGSPEAFNRVRRAWDILRAKWHPRSRNLRTGNTASTKSAAPVQRARPYTCPKQGPAPSRLCSVHFQTQQSSLFGQGVGRKFDLLETWRKDLLASVKERQLLVQKVATPTSLLANRPVKEVVTTTSRPANALAKEGDIAPWMKLALRGSMGRSVRTRRDRKRKTSMKDTASKRRKLSAEAASRNAAGDALTQHIRAEQAAVDAAAKNDPGRLTEVRCPMLARHLRDERVAVAAAEVEQRQHQQQQQPEPQSPSATTTATTDGTSESSVFETKLADLAAKLRATPREERRRLLMKLPKATRDSLEAFVLAGRKVCDPAHSADNVAHPRGEVPQFAACWQPAPTKVGDVGA